MGRFSWRVMRASERLMAIELVLKGELITFVSVYAPQVGQPHERRMSFMMSYTGLSVS